MCSISGFFNPEADFLIQSEYYNKILCDMKNTLKHRGPDDSGIILKKRCGLSHTRLSIIDLKSGQQPMTRNMSDYSFSIIYNGEIYNMSFLKNRLLKRGYSFMTTSDTEILLLSFIEFGADFVKDVDGIFAFAIYDERHETLLLFRDAFGVKPLFYTFNNGTIIFSSEIKGILCFPGTRAVLDKNGLNEILGLGPARTPGSGILKNFYELKPGTYMRCNKFGTNISEYYHLESRPHYDSYEDTIEKTRFLVTDAIKRQMISDVPICTFLSGGVDSSVVSSVCAKELNKQNKQLSTFSFDFIENDKYFKANSFQPSMDRPYVDKMVDFINSSHTYLECNNTIQADYLYKSVIAHDLPCMADIDSSLLYFCEEVSKTHKVVLTGECADEVFGGYPWFHKDEFLNSNTFPWTPTLEPRKMLLKQELLDYIDMDDYVKNVYNTAISEINILPQENETETNRRRISYLNIRFFMQTLLNRMDRTSMHSGLEARVPFADKALVDYVFNIPWEMKAKNGVVKNILRQASSGIVPDEILYRKKSPYPKTYNPFYEKLLASRLIEILDDTSSPLHKIIDNNAIKKFLDSPKDYGKPWYGQLMAAPQMIAYLLQIDYFIKAYRVEMENL
ncbi:MAG: asparagine synthase (glutamine-hydrolyzing) [Eubacterium sp.]